MITIWFALAYKSKMAKYAKCPEDEHMVPASLHPKCRKRDRDVFAVKLTLVVIIKIPLAIIEEPFAKEEYGKHLSITQG